MTKNEHIEYWKATASEDWETVQTLFNNNHYLHCLFFAHLTIEKLLKANWVRCSKENIPPRTHNLIKLIQETDLQFEQDDLIFIQGFNDFQLEGRYPDHLFKIKAQYNREVTQDVLTKAKKIKECLQEKVQ